MRFITRITILMANGSTMPPDGLAAQARCHKWRQTTESTPICADQGPCM
jgi:hypothetical protein